MQYTSNYRSPIGDILLACDEIGLTGLWFEGEKFYALSLENEHEPRETPVFDETKRWLDVYFSGREPDFLPPLHRIGSPFQLRVWELLQRIPYGETTTYGALASEVAAEPGDCPHVGAGGRGRGRAQRNLHHHPVPPRGRRKRQPDRLCRRHRQKAGAASAGGR